MDFDEDTLHQIHLGSLLHDIGNLGIPDSILLKPTGLTSWEFDEMKLHGIIGQTICRPIKELAPALPLIRSHHEKLDGSGYPDALEGDAILPAVRVLSVTDVYDTLRCERAYRDAFTHEKAIEILHQEAERGWWDARIVDRLADLTAPQSDFLSV
jgi:HD-GYP domain-containing protein (c-di-GMP phosphodiesterase class II)